MSSCPCQECSRYSEVQVAQSFQGSCDSGHNRTLLCSLRHYGERRRRDVGPPPGSLCLDGDLAGRLGRQRLRFEPLSDWWQFGSPFPTPMINPGPETVNSIKSSAVGINRPFSSRASTRNTATSSPSALMYRGRHPGPLVYEFICNINHLLSITYGGGGGSRTRVRNRWQQREAPCSVVFRRFRFARSEPTRCAHR